MMVGLSTFSLAKTEQFSPPPPFPPLKYFMICVAYLIFSVSFLALKSMIFSPFGKHWDQSQVFKIALVI
jgi:hypothetical protein